MQLLFSIGCVDSGAALASLTALPADSRDMLRPSAYPVGMWLQPTLIIAHVACAAPQTDGQGHASWTWVSDMTGCLYKSALAQLAAEAAGTDLSPRADCHLQNQVLSKWIFQGFSGHVEHDAASNQLRFPPSQQLDPFKVVFPPGL